MRRLLFIVGLLAWLVSPLVSVAVAQTPSISVLDLGASSFAKKTREKLRERLASTDEFKVADADLTRAAAKGIGYAGSLNLSVNEARDLGGALATDFYVIGDVQTLRRSSFARPVYYESYCSLFLVNARTGELLFWDRPSLQSDRSGETEDRIWSEIGKAKTVERIGLAIRQAQYAKRAHLEQAAVNAEPLIEEAPEDDKAAEELGVRLPRPYARLRPEYPETAARAEAEGTVDVLVDVRADGEVGDIRVARWAGFGLDETTVATVRKMHFFPAMKNGTAIAMRVLLRYNFRKPPR